MPEDDHAKGVLYFNIYVVGISGLFLLTQLLYIQIPEMSVSQLIFGRSLVASIGVLMINNVNYKKRVYDDVPSSMVKMLVLRCFLTVVGIFLEFTVIKYLSLVYQGIARNLTPIATLLMAVYMNGEKISAFDALFTIVSLGGVIMIVAGLDSGTVFIREVDSQTVVFVFIGTALLPIINALGSILLRRLKGLHENTVSCIVNPFVMLFMLAVIVANGEFTESW